MSPAVVATALVAWSAFSLLLNAAWAAGVITMKPIGPTKTVSGWLIKLSLSGLVIWAVVYLART